MLDFNEELAKFQPCADLEEAEESIGVCEDSENQKYRRRTTVHDKCEFCEQIYQDRSEI